MNEEKLASMVAEIARSFGWEVAFHTRDGEVVGISVADTQRMNTISALEMDNGNEVNVWAIKEIDA